MHLENAQLGQHIQIIAVKLVCTLGSDFLNLASCCRLSIIFVFFPLNQFYIAAYPCSFTSLLIFISPNSAAKLYFLDLVITTLHLSFLPPKTWSLVQAGLNYCVVEDGLYLECYNYRCMLPLLAFKRCWRPSPGLCRCSVSTPPTELLFQSLQLPFLCCIRCFISL